MARVGVAFGGRTVEHQVSIRSARTVIGALEEVGHEVVPLGIAQDGCWLEPGVSQRAVDGDLDSLEALGEPLSPTLRHLLDSSIEVLFPVVHGTWGEDGTLQGLCEMLDLPYVGAGVGALKSAARKLRSTSRGVRVGQQVELPGRSGTGVEGAARPPVSPLRETQCRWVKRRCSQDRGTGGATVGHRLCSALRHHCVERAGSPRS